MAVQKISIAIEDSIVEAARIAAEREGLSLSAWLTNAADEALAIDRGLEDVREWEAVHGPISADALARADRILDAHGIFER